MKKEERLLIVDEISKIASDPNGDAERLQFLRDVLEGKRELPADYLEKKKAVKPLQAAREILETDGDISIEEVAEETGASKFTLKTYVQQRKIIRPEPSKKEAPKVETMEEKGEVLRLRKEVKQHENTIAATDNLLKEAEEDMEESKNIILGLEEKLKELQEENRSLKASADGIGNEKNKYRKEVLWLEKENESFREIELRAMKEIESLREQLKTANESISKLYGHQQEDYKELQGRADRAERKHDALLEYTLLRLGVEA